MYYVVSDGAVPSRIYFDFKKACESQSTYIDSFDEEGLLVESFTFNGEEANDGYTVNF